ncbi:MAG: TAXI family TRAP transporter solute-binding subunit [Synergistaceae bacterium]|jgi:TRAP transporter TAXI family solute receptor|nr:TAXI family TRAP transporter solute-binding subunit [Synergistaceae bacterium]
MKKIVMLCICIILIIMAATGTLASERYDLSICGASIGGAWAAIGEGVGETIRRSYPGSNTAYEVGQEAANIALVSSGKIQLGIAHAQLIGLAMKGEAPFGDRKMDNLRAICVLYGEAVEHFMLLESTGIKTFEDLKDKKYPLKLNLNTKDSFMEIVGKKTLEAYGITYDDITSWGGNVEFMSMGPSLDLMRDGKKEAFMNVIQLPSSHVVDVSTNLKMTMLSVGKEVQDKLNADIGTYSSVIPKGMYNFVGEDTPTVAATVILFANDSLSDEEAYAVVKSISDNFSYFKNIHASLADITLEQMSETNPVPLHPGARKFYEENKK